MLIIFPVYYFCALRIRYAQLGTRSHQEEKSTRVDYLTALIFLLGSRTELDVMLHITIIWLEVIIIYLY